MNQLFEITRLIDFFSKLTNNQNFEYQIKHMLSNN
jgi:hypothetical protein